MPVKKSKKPAKPKKAKDPNEPKVVGKGKNGSKKVLIDNIVFDSKMEGEYYEYLKAEKAAGRIRDFEMQTPYLLQEGIILFGGKKYFTGLEDKEIKRIKKEHKGEYRLIKPITYVSDFVVTYADGSRKVIDVKGFETADFKLKRKMFDFRYPELTLQLVIKYDGQWWDFDENKKRQAAARKEKKKKAKEKLAS